MDIKDAIVKRFRELCDEKGIKINELANISGVPLPTLNNILYGKSKNPGVVTLKMICDGLGISLTDFFMMSEFESFEQDSK